MRRAVFFLLVLAQTISSVLAAVYYDGSQIRSIVEIDQSAYNPVVQARNKAIMEINDAMYSEVLKLSEQYIASRSDDLRPYYEEAGRNVSLRMYSAGIRISENIADGKVEASVNFESHVGRNFDTMKKRLDEEASYIRQREARMKAAVIPEATEEENILLIKAAYYIHEYEHGRIGKVENPVDSMSLIGPLGLSDALMIVYLASAAAQVEQAPEYVKQAVIGAAAIKYMYL